MHFPDTLPLTPQEALLQEDTLCLEPASLPPPQESLCTCPTLQRAPQTLTPPGFTGPDILRSGSPGSVNTTRERALSLKQTIAFKWQCRSHGKATTQFVLEFISQTPHKINGPLEIMLI